MKKKTITKLRVGDNAIVLSGKFKNSQGEIQRILPEDKCIIKGVGLVKKHKKALKQGDKSEIISVEAPITLSKVSFCEDNKAVKLGYKIEDGKKVRYNKKSNEILATKNKKS